MRIQLFSILVTLFAIFQVPAHAEVPEHFFNDPANLHPDPAYTPGDYALADISKAKTLFQIKKSEVFTDEVIMQKGNVFTLGLGEITFSSIKNESASVLGYFRNYSGVATVGDNGPEDVQLVIDVNSLDTGVPGRDNRILNLFFESMKPDLGTIRVRFDSFDLAGQSFSDVAKETGLTVMASGKIKLNGVTRDIKSKVTVKLAGGSWEVQTAEPIRLLISDFAFGDRPYALMKECNHKALGNAVDVNVKLYFR